MSRLIGLLVVLWALVAGISIATVTGGRSGPAGAPAETAATGGRLTAARGDGVELEARAASAPRAKAQTSKDFEYVRYSVDTSQASPKACLSFSAALDPKTDYSAYVTLEPAAPTAISVSGQTLCLGGLAFGASHDIVIREGLPAADGRKLAAGERTPLEFADRPSYVGFAGSGVILPRREADGLAIETVNVDAVDVTVRRVTDRALVFKQITEGFAVGEGDWWWTNSEEEADDVGEVIWRGVMDTAGQPNAPTTTVFPLAAALERLEAGAYHVAIAQHRENADLGRNPARAERWIIFTDLAFTAYRGADGLDVVLRSLQTAKPLSNTTVQLVARSNEVLAQARTDTDGRVRFSKRLTAGEGPSRPRLLMAFGREGDFAILDLDRAPVDITSENIAGRAAPANADGFVWLDRGIYRPGETVRASAMLRDAAASALSTRAGAFVVVRPNGIEAARTRFDGAAQAGAVFLDYDVAKDAARGLWRVRVEIDGLGVVGEESFAVEDFVPQRVALELDADADAPLAMGETRAIQADARFLYGAPGAGLAIEGEARVEVDPSPFKSFAGYRFGRHDETFREVRIDMADAVADGAGKASLIVDPGAADAGSTKPLRVNAVVSVLEPGGRAVRESVRMPYRPREVYLGLNPQFDGGTAPTNQAVQFDVAAVARDGTPAPADLAWTLVRIDWEYDWYRDVDGEWRWRRTREVVPIEEGVITATADTAASLATRPLDWGDYELVVTDKTTGGETSMGFWVGWGGRAEAGVEAPDRVRVSAPKDPVAVGGRAEFAILAPYAGQAEVVLATDRVLESRSITVPEAGAHVAFDVTEDWGAGAYLMVSVFTPRDPVDAPKPRRAVGVAHAPVDMGARTFELAMNAPELVRPRTTLNLEVTATGPKPGPGAWLTVAAVDEGILRLTKFASPDPVEHFYGKKRLDVALLDDYGRLLDPNQGAAAALRAGGDQLGGEGLTVVPTKSVALFSGPVRLDSSGKAVVKLDIPDFNGELRLMAVAWSPNAVGAADQALTVRDPVPAELVLPRFLAPGDEAFATATLDNVDGAAGAYAIDVKATGPVEAPADMVEASLDKGQRRDAPVLIAAGDEGIANLRIDVAGPEGFSVSRAYPLQSRSPYLPTSRVDRKLMSPGDMYAVPADALAGYVAGSGNVLVSFSAIPMDAGALYDSLDKYPYGCTEQITSRALPLLYAGEIAALSDRKTSGAAARELQAAVSTLLNRQSADGAFGLWRVGDRNASPWLGVFATDFLARAKAAGYAVPDAAMERAYQAVSYIADGDMWGGGGYDGQVYTSRWNPDSFALLRARASAYAVYVLARAGRADVSRLRYVHDEELARMPGPLAKAHVGAALAYAGDQARAIDAFAKAEEALGYDNRGDYYQTPRRDLAGLLALAAEAADGERVERLSQRVAEDLPDPDRLSTQEKAFLLLAAHALLGGDEGVKVEATGAAAEGPAGLRYRLDEAGVAGEATFVNQGSGAVWRTTVARGAPVAAPPKAAEGLVVQKSLRTPDGRAVDPGSINQGDRLVVTLTLTPKERRLLPMIVADLLPAGFEIEATLRPEDAGDGGLYAWIGDLGAAKVQEARDDRYVAAVDLRGETVKLAYVVRAVTAGRFSAPGVVAEDMYRPDIFARSEAFAVRVAGRS